MDPSLVFVRSEHRSQATVSIHTQDTEAWVVSEIAQMIWGAEPTPYIFQANVARYGPHSMQFRFFRALNKIKNHVTPNEVKTDEMHRKTAYQVLQEIDEWRLSFQPNLFFRQLFVANEDHNDRSAQGGVGPSNT